MQKNTAFKIIGKKAQSFVDLTYLLTFVAKFIVFYFLCKYFILAWFGVVDPKGAVYSAFCAHYLNFFVFIKLFVFKSSVFLAGLFGVHSFQETTNTLRVQGKGHLVMKLGCYGLKLMSFWLAFVLADSTLWKRKIVWAITGIAALLVINSLRVTLLLVALDKRWNIHFLDVYKLTHHTMFNIVAYGLVFLLMYMYCKRNKDSMELTKTQRILRKPGVHTEQLYDG